MIDDQMSTKDSVNTDNQVRRATVIPRLYARIAELEAEVTRLTVERNLWRYGISRGEALAYRSEDHGPAKKPIR